MLKVTFEQWLLAFEWLKNKKIHREKDVFGALTCILSSNCGAASKQCSVPSKGFEFGPILPNLTKLEWSLCENH